MCYSGEPLTVQLPGTQTRSFCYVSDMVYMKCCLFFVFLFAFQCWFMVVIFFISIRLMALFVSWKEKTLVLSTLETQVTLQYQWFLCAVCPDFSVVLVWIELIIIHYSFRWVYYDWTCWECERGQFWTVLVLLKCQICIFILVYHI
jgi:hypothetical protein